MSKKRIFISCGQRTDEEKRFGQELQELIGGKNNMEGFFAEEAHDPADLNTALFRELQRCDGFVAVLQRRGEVHYDPFPLKHRASVWIQQEIGILFYRSFLLGRPVPMRIYIQEGVLHEGLSAFSIINPIPFSTKTTVIDDLSSWLEGPMFEEQPVLARREDLFLRQTQSYEDHHWLMLELIAVYSREPGDRVNQAFLSRYFVKILQEEGKDITEDPGTLFKNTLVKLVSDGLVTDAYEKVGGIYFYSLEPPWWDLIHDELRNRARIAVS